MSDATSKSLSRLLREEDEEDLLELVRARGEELGPESVGQALRNPFVSSRVIEVFLKHPRLLRFYEVRCSIAAHPRTPGARAMRLVSGLFWRDLMRIGSDTRIPPTVRRTADRRLADRLPGLAVGEKMVIARGAGPGLIQFLRHDPDPRVIAALLENPRLTEGILMPLVCDEGARPETLKTIARDRRWGLRYNLRVGLCRNPRTPVETALELLSGLKKRDLEAVAGDPRLPRALRRRADLLLGRGGPS